MSCPDSTYIFTTLTCLQDPKLLKKMCSGTFLIKTVSHPAYILRSADKKATKYPVHIRRLRNNVQFEYGPNVLFGARRFRN